MLSDDILARDARFSSVDMVREYRLQDLVRDYDSLSLGEVSFIKNNSRLDFLLYSKIDKSPILAIEVDGVSFHDNNIQRERDSKKDHILKIVGVPLLRLSTDGHDEQVRIIDALTSAMRNACS